MDGGTVGMRRERRKGHGEVRGGRFFRRKRGVAWGSWRGS